MNIPLSKVIFKYEVALIWNDILKLENYLNARSYLLAKSLTASCCENLLSLTAKFQSVAPFTNMD